MSLLEYPQAFAQAVFAAASGLLAAVGCMHGPLAIRPYVHRQAVGGAQHPGRGHDSCRMLGRNVVGTVTQRSKLEIPHVPSHVSRIAVGRTGGCEDQYSGPSACKAGLGRTGARAGDKGSEPGR